MRPTIAALLLGLFAFRATAAADLPPGRWTHTRALTEGAMALLEDGVAHSPLVASLLSRVEAGDIVVYVTDARPSAPGEPASRLAFLSLASATRYLLIRIDPLKLTAGERIVALGHELQHALEVAAAPEVRSAAGLTALYRRIGWEGRQDRFETQEAREVSRRVRSELMHPAKMALRQSEAIADAEARARAERGGPTSR